MGLIHIELFATLDLVGQAPGGPDEDRDGGFPFGGWQAPLMDEVAGATVLAAYEATYFGTLLKSVAISLSSPPSWCGQ